MRKKNFLCGECDLITVLGDSHCRTFSYSSEFVPVFIAPGKNLLLNSDEFYEKTKKLILENIDLIKSSSSFSLLLLGEPSLRFFLISRSKVVDADVVDQFVDSYLTRLSSLQYELQKVSSCKVVVLPPVPREDEDYASLWVKVREGMKYRGYENHSIFDAAVDSLGRLKKEYIGDYIHANEELCDLVARQLNVIRFNALSSELNSWSFFYTLPTGAKIWGGVPISFLKYKGKDARNWKCLLKKSYLADKVISLVSAFNFFSKLFLSRNVTLVADNIDEGYFSLYSNSDIDCYWSSNCELRRKRLFFLFPQLIHREWCYERNANSSSLIVRLADRVNSSFSSRTDVEILFLSSNNNDVKGWAIYVDNSYKIIMKFRDGVKYKFIIYWGSWLYFRLLKLF